MALWETYWTGSGLADGYKVNFRYMGKNMTSKKLVVQKAEIASYGLGSAEFRGLNKKYDDIINLTSSELMKKTTKGKDVILGSRKSDIIYGEKGNDKIYANSGRDKLIGGKGNDRIYGGSSGDILTGGSGKDRLWGQGGSDTFRVERGSGYDIIKDFTDGEDKIQIIDDASGLKLSRRGDHVLIRHRGDLVAVVENAAGDLQLNGSYVV